MSSFRTAAGKLCLLDEDVTDVRVIVPLPSSTSLTGSHFGRRQRPEDIQPAQREVSTFDAHFVVVFPDGCADVAGDVL